MTACFVYSELASRLPTVAYHRRTTRLAVAVDPAPAGGTVAIVYDLTAAATWRTLIDRDEGTGDDTAVSWMDGWTNTIASYAGSKDATSSPTSGGSPTFFNSGRRSARTSRSSRDGAAAGDSPLSPEARTARANAAMAAIPTPETPEQQIAAAAAAAAAAMLQSRRDSFDGGSTATTPRASQSHSVASAGGANDRLAYHRHGMGRERRAAGGVFGPCKSRSRLERIRRFRKESLTEPLRSLHPGYRE